MQLGTRDANTVTRHVERKEEKTDAHVALNPSLVHDAIHDWANSIAKMWFDLYTLSACFVLIS